MRHETRRRESHVVNYFKFFAGVLILFLAVSLQFWFGSWGLYANFVLAALVAFAFLFNIQEFIFLLLFGVFIMNWQPAISRDILAFALVPMLVFIARSRFHWDAYIGSAISIVAGITLFYVVLAPAMIVQPFGGFLIDIAAALIFGEAVVWGMSSF